MPDHSSSPEIRSDSELRTVLAELLRERMTSGESLHIPGLGTFSVEHQLSSVEEQEGEQIVMAPPRDTVVFESDLSQ